MLEDLQTMDDSVDPDPKEVVSDPEQLVNFHQFILAEQLLLHLQ